MITPELQNYIQQSLQQGKTPEEIKNTLRQGGGWTEYDLNQAFSIGTKKGAGIFLKVIIPVIIVALGIGGYLLYKTNSQKQSVGNESTKNTPTTSNAANTIVDTSSTPQEIDCGTSDTLPIPQYENTYKNDPVLKCLGENALKQCTSAKASVANGFNDSLATIHITNTNGCYFKLTVTQSKDTYTLCPLSVAKEIYLSDNNIVTSKSLDVTDPARYGAGIFNYAQIGLVLENHGENDVASLAKFKSSGCTGDLFAFMLQSLQNSRSKAGDAAIKQQISSSRLDAENYRDTQPSEVVYKNVCQTALKKDIDSLKNLHSTVTCYDSVWSYAISASLSTGSFACSDSTGFNGEIKNNITGTKCQ